MQTLSDQVLGKIDIDYNTSGRAPVLSLEEEAKLVNHLQEVAKLGSGTVGKKLLMLPATVLLNLANVPKISN